MLRIDSHHHLWDQSVRPQSWMDEATRSVIGGPYSLEDWSEAATPAGIRHGVFVQTVPDAAETPEVLALAEGHPELSAVVGWLDLGQDPRSPGEQLDALLAGPGGDRLAGIRVAAQHTSPTADWLDSAEVAAVAVALAERNLSLDLLMHPESLGAAARLAQAQPETRIIIDHLAKPTMREEDFASWAAEMSTFTALEQVACKFSGFLTFDESPMTASRLAPYAQTALDTFGPARMMFGSDWPVSVLGGGYAAAVEVAEQTVSALSVTERERIWAGTALRWYSALEAVVSSHGNDN